MDTYEWSEMFFKSDLRKAKDKEILEKFLKKHNIKISREELALNKRNYCVNRASAKYRTRRWILGQREEIEVRKLKRVRSQLLAERDNLQREIWLYQSHIMGEQNGYYFR